MAALLIGMSVMAIMMTVAMPVWKQSATREKEAELVFRGEQYKRALGLFQRRSGPGTMPPNIDVLVDQKFLRKKYKDPITGGDFEVLGPNSAGAGLPPTQPGRGGPPISRGAQPSAQQPSPGRSSQPGGTIGGTAGVIGVVSKSKATSIRLYNGRNHYNEWQFVYTPQQQAGGGGGGGTGGPGRGGPGRGGDGRGRGDGRGGPPSMPFPAPPGGGRTTFPTFPQGRPPGN
jgi:type II secretory pathway pseudopilin PulG